MLRDSESGILRFKVTPNPGLGLPQDPPPSLQATKSLPASVWGNLVDALDKQDQKMLDSAALEPGQEPAPNVAGVSAPCLAV